MARIPVAPVAAMRRLAEAEIEREALRWSRPRRTGSNALAGIMRYVRGEDLDPWAEPLAVMTLAGGGIGGAAYVNHQRHRGYQPTSAQRNRRDDIQKWMRAIRRRERIERARLGGYRDGLWLNHQQLGFDLNRYEREGFPARDNPDIGLVYSEPPVDYPGQYFVDVEGNEQ